MKRFGLICIILTFMFTFTFMGCSGMSLQQPDPDPVCERPGAELSYICRVLTDKGISVKDANLLFKGINIILIQKDAYTKEQFLKFIDEVEGLINASSTYENLSAYLLTVVGNFNSDYKVEIILLADYFSDFTLAVDISDFDRDLLLEHIKQQRFIVSFIE